MSEYHFGCGRGRIPNRRAARVDKIARKHGACFVTYTEPGTTPPRHRYWFSCPNLGHPFDQTVRNAVAADLQSAGLDIDDLSQKQR